jgi:shikimate dehydrogenase
MNITGSSALFGVIGYPVSHSLSPVFQNAALRHIGINGVYIPFEVKPESLREALQGFKAIGNLVGLNVTIPHKEAVLELVDRVADEVERIGSANTLRFSEGKVEAFNTDWIGFLRAAEEVVNLTGKKVLLLGAGGTSRAVVFALKRAGAEVHVWNRTIEKAERLAEEFGIEVVRDIHEALEEAEVVVNTTSVGLRNDDPPLFDYSQLRKEQTVIDVIYKETPLIRSAKKIGCRVQTGFPMLVYQGAESLRLWTGCEPPLKIMKSYLRDYGYPTENSRTQTQTL